MRNIDLEEYNKKRKESRMYFLKLRDRLEKEPCTGERPRSREKRFMLYRLAERKGKKHIKKISKGKYIIEY